MADIWLMRHAAYEGHRPGYHAPPEAELTEEGRTSILDALPLPTGIAGLLTSPLKRAQITAEIIAAETGLPILISSDLFAEWHAPSMVIGRSRSHYPPEYQAWRDQRLHDPESKLDGGESLAAFHRRAHQCIKELEATADRHGSVLLVSHQLLLGVLTHLDQGPAAFETAAGEPWPFAQIRRWERA